jgi:hypothetical protein
MVSAGFSDNTGKSLLGSRSCLKVAVSVTDAFANESFLYKFIFILQKREFKF